METVAILQIPCGLQITTVQTPDGHHVTVMGNPRVIPNGAFQNSTFTAITLPSSITTIEDDAFRGCEGLRRISLPDGVRVIGTRAFQDCVSLVEITLCENLEYIYGSAFMCASLTTISIPETVTHIGHSAFYGCPLTEFDIPSGVTEISNCTFYNCRSLKRISIPEGVTTIGVAAFFKCASLTAVDIPESVTTIQACAFYECSIRRITISGVNEIDDEAFTSCTSLKVVAMPLSGVHRNAFKDCHSLAVVIFPERADPETVEILNTVNSLRAAVLPTGSAWRPSRLHKHLRFTGTGSEHFVRAYRYAFWSRGTHRSMPSDVKEIVKTVMLVRGRMGGKMYLPLEMWEMILMMNWLDGR